MGGWIWRKQLEIYVQRKKAAVGRGSILVGPMHSSPQERQHVGSWAWSIMVRGGREENMGLSQRPSPQQKQRAGNSE